MKKQLKVMGDSYILVAFPNNLNPESISLENVGCILYSVQGSEAVNKTYLPETITEIIDTIPLSKEAYYNNFASKENNPANGLLTLIELRNCAEDTQNRWVLLKVK